MPISPFDIAIILISSVACLYCIVLSRRLKALQNTRNGLGATIKALSDSISAVSATTDETRYHAGELATRLAHLIEDARLSSTRVEDLIKRLEEAHARAEEQMRQRPPAAAPVAPPVSQAITPAPAETDQKLQEISELMDRLKDLTENSVAAASSPSPAPHSAPPEQPIPLRSRMKVV